MSEEKNKLELIYKIPKLEKCTTSQKSHICHQQILFFSFEAAKYRTELKKRHNGNPVNNSAKKICKPKQWIAWKNTWATHTFLKRHFYSSPPTNTHHSHIYPRINCSTYITSLDLSVMPFTFTVSPNRFFRATHILHKLKQWLQQHQRKNLL